MTKPLEQTVADLRAWAESQPPAVKRCASSLANYITVWEMWPKSEGMRDNTMRLLGELQAMACQSSRGQETASGGVGRPHTAGERQK